MGYPISYGACSGLRTHWKTLLESGILDTCCKRPSAEDKTTEVLCGTRRCHPTWKPLMALGSVSGQDVCTLARRAPGREGGVGIGC